MPQKKRSDTKGSSHKKLDPEVSKLEQQIAANRPFVTKLLANQLARTKIESQLSVIECDHDVGCVFRIERGSVNRAGIFTFDLYPWWLGDWANRAAAEILRDVGSEYLKQLKAEDPRVISKEFLERGNPELAELFAAEFIETLPGKLAHALVELECEIRLIIRAWLMRSQAIEAHDRIDEYVKAQSKTTRDFLKQSIDQFGKPKWDQLQAHFDELLPNIKAAKDLQKKHNRRDMRAAIREGFPEFEGDENLIAILCNTEPKNFSLPLPPDNNVDYSLPSNMALEMAARRCGMKPFRLKPRRIRDLMKNGSESVQSSDKSAALKPTKPAQPSTAETSQKGLDSQQVH